MERPRILSLLHQNTAPAHLSFILVMMSDVMCMCHMQGQSHQVVPQFQTSQLTAKAKGYLSEAKGLKLSRSCGCWAMRDSIVWRVGCVGCLWGLWLICLPHVSPHLQFLAKNLIPRHGTWIYLSGKGRREKKQKQRDQRKLKENHQKSKGICILSLNMDQTELEKRTLLDELKHLRSSMPSTIWRSLCNHTWLTVGI